MQQQIDSKKTTQKPKKLPLPIKLGVGAVAGVIGTTCIFPIDMIKTRLQAASSSSSNPLKVLQNIVANEGTTSTTTTTTTTTIITTTTTINTINTNIY